MNVQLHVGNLTYEATADELRRLFVPYGNIADIQIPKDRGDGTAPRIRLRYHGER